MYRNTDVIQHLNDIFNLLAFCDGVRQMIVNLSEG